METYLNLAHRSHRKAEHYNKCHQFSEAIFHFTKAAEYLGNSIQNTTCDTIRSSLIVQRSYYLDQIEFLKRRILNKIIRKDINTKLNNTIQLSSLDYHRHHNSNNKRNITELKTTKTIMAFNVKNIQCRELYNVLKEQELLLNHLMRKTNPSPERNASSTSVTTGNYSNKSTSNANDENALDSNRAIVEELKTLNEKLKNLFSNLVENLDKTKQEVQTLQKENQTLRKEIVTLKNDQSLTNVNKGPQPFPELPPLEPPTLLY